MNADENKLTSRRSFVLSLAGLPIFAALPNLPTVQNINAVGMGEEAIDGTVNDVIRALEQYLGQHSDRFSMSIHNELRHQYWVAGNERMSRKHADIILKHSIMDDYILHTLSNWHLTHHHNAYSPAKAIHTLLDNADRYGDLPHLSAACIVKSGDIYKENGMPDQATRLYQILLSDENVMWVQSNQLQQYHIVAHHRNSFLI